MKATINDPWNESGKVIENHESSFEDSFVDVAANQFSRLPDSEEYLASLCELVIIVKNQFFKL